MLKSILKFRGPCHEKFVSPNSEEGISLVTLQISNHGDSVKTGGMRYVRDY